VGWIWYPQRYEGDDLVVETVLAEGRGSTKGIPVDNIIVGRYDRDPEAQGVVKAESGRWQVVVDKEGYPHLWVEVSLEDGQKGMFCVDYMLPVPIKDLMDGGCFGGELSPEEEAEAQAECEAEAHPPCPR
jgi:hypothetical protein